MINKFSQEIKRGVYRQRKHRMRKKGYAITPILNAILQLPAADGYHSKIEWYKLYHNHDGTKKLGYHTYAEYKKSNIFSTKNIKNKLTTQTNQTTNKPKQLTYLKKEKENKQIQNILKEKQAPEIEPIQNAKILKVDLDISKLTIREKIGIFKHTFKIGEQIYLTQLLILANRRCDSYFEMVHSDFISDEQYLSDGIKNSKSLSQETKDFLLKKKKDTSKNPEIDSQLNNYFTKYKTPKLLEKEKQQILNELYSQIDANQNEVKNNLNKLAMWIVIAFWVFGTICLASIIIHG